jgi:hypothetical protein
MTRSSVCSKSGSQKRPLASLRRPHSKGSFTALGKPYQRSTSSTTFDRKHDTVSLLVQSRPCVDSDGAQVAPGSRVILDQITGSSWLPATGQDVASPVGELLVETGLERRPPAVAGIAEPQEVPYSGLVRRLLSTRAPMLRSSWMKRSSSSGILEPWIIFRVLRLPRGLATLNVVWARFHRSFHP